MNAECEQRVLVLHNRYRLPGGEERAVASQLAALDRARVPARLVERRSDAVGPGRAALALLRGGDDPDAVAAAVEAFRATVVHAHNLHPLLGVRALQAARAAGARVVLHLHNFRLFCAIGVAFREGQPCFRCRGRLTLPGLVLNCRDSMPEAVVYAAALAGHQPALFEVIDRFATPSAYAAGQLARLGVPPERLDVVPHPIEPAALAARSGADRGRYALVAARLDDEKGVDVAIDAAARAGVALLVAGDGPLREALAARVSDAAAPVELLGRVPEGRLRSLLAGAAMAVVPSRGGETFGLAALEAMAAGVPVIAARTGGLPEVVGEERCVPRGDVPALAAAMSALWRDPEARRVQGEALLHRARERFGEGRYVADLLALYARAGAGRAASGAHA